MEHQCHFQQQDNWKRITDNFEPVNTALGSRKRHMFEY